MIGKRSHVCNYNACASFLSSLLRFFASRRLSALVFALARLAPVSASGAGEGDLETEGTAAGLMIARGAILGASALASTVGVVCATDDKTLTAAPSSLLAFFFFFLPFSNDCTPAASILAFPFPTDLKRDVSSSSSSSSSVLALLILALEATAPDLARCFASAEKSLDPELGPAVAVAPGSNRGWPRPSLRQVS